jgi:hypothetical protein
MCLRIARIEKYKIRIMVEKPNLFPFFELITFEKVLISFFTPKIEDTKYFTPKKFKFLLCFSIIFLQNQKIFIGLGLKSL